MKKNEREARVSETKEPRNQGTQRIVGSCWELGKARALPWKQKRVASCQQLLTLDPRTVRR